MGLQTLKQGKISSPPVAGFRRATCMILTYYMQCCGSGMFIPDPDFYPSRIPDPGSRISDPKTAKKERGEKKLVVIPFYVATNFTKLKIILALKC
jgi:hypothetical protein